MDREQAIRKAPEGTRDRLYISAESFNQNYLLRISFVPLECAMVLRVAESE
jgi:hypothetical protein